MAKIFPIYEGKSNKTKAAKDLPTYAMYRSNIYRRILYHLVTLLILLGSATLLYFLFSTIPLAKVSPYMEWMEYSTPYYQIAEFFFSLMVVSGFPLSGALQSLLKQLNSYEKNWKLPFSLSFNVTILTFTLSLVALILIIRPADCDVPYITFQKETDINTPLHSGTVILSPLDTWIPITAVIDDDASGKLICRWETEEGIRLSENSTCSIYVSASSPIEGTLTLRANTNICGNSIRIAHLTFNFR